MPAPIAKPWLSVLVPAYNAAAFLPECVESVLGQGVEGVELVVLDDSSSDASARVLEDLCKRWPHALQVFRHVHNAGLSAARNTLLETARGEYVWFLDADDKLLPGSVQALHAVVAETTPDLVLCDFEVLRERRQLKHWLRGEQHRRTFEGPPGVFQGGTDALLCGMLLPGQLHAWSKIARRGLWGEDVRFPAGEYFEDMATMALLALRAEKVHYVPESWVAYRQHGRSILANATWEKAQDQSRALVPLRQALKMRGGPLSEELQLALAHQSARNLMGAMRYLDAQADALQTLGPVNALAQQLRDNFLESSPLSADALAQAYSHRGWWLRRHKFLRWYGAFGA